MFAKPEDGGDALVLVLGDDVVGKGAGLGAEAVFGGDEEALLFVIRVLAVILSEAKDLCGRRR